MAHRPYFVPRAQSRPHVAELFAEFSWHSGMSISHKQKTIQDFHAAIKRNDVSKNPLEVSSKSFQSVVVCLICYSLQKWVGFLLCNRHFKAARDSKTEVLLGIYFLNNPRMQSVTHDWPAPGIWQVFRFLARNDLCSLERRSMIGCTSMRCTKMLD